MAEYVTLKKADGTVIYPQSVIGQVADGSITADKLDWTSYLNFYKNASNNTSAQYPISWTNKLSVLVAESGTYRIEGMVHAATNELAQDWYARARILVGSGVPSGFPVYTEALIAGAQNYYACACIVVNGVATLTAGQYVRLSIMASLNNARCQCSYSNLFIQRIS